MAEQSFQQDRHRTSPSTALLVLSLVLVAGGLVRIWQVHRAGDVAGFRGASLVLAWLLVPASAGAISTAACNARANDTVKKLVASRPACGAWLK